LLHVPVNHIANRLLLCTRRREQILPIWLCTRHRVLCTRRLWRTVCHTTVCNAFRHFRVFFRKTTTFGDVFKILYRTFSIATPIDLFCSNCVKFGRREIDEIVGSLPDNKTKKICLAYVHPNGFTFGCVIAERVNTAKTHRKVNPIFS